jgi:tetratricopeptide (TPR) repeat protein
MASENPKQPAKRPAPAPASSAGPTAPARSVAPPAVPATPRLFRAVDWLGFALTCIISFAGYLYTLAPDLTLQDSGELAVGSFYAGVPHPPGYPVWTIYTWFFTKIIPFGNVAFRVGISSAFAGAMACGLISLMVSRGSSMFMESIAEFKSIERRVENWICLVSGVVAGLLIAFNAFMWSQSIIVEVYSLSMLSLTGSVICLLHWTYTPHRYRYLYLAWFLCGISFNNHQSLFVTTIAMEVLMVAVQARLGRAMLLGNSIFYFLGIIAYGKGGLAIMQGNTPVLLIFNMLGICFVVGWIWLSIKTKPSAADLVRDVILALPPLLLLSTFSKQNPLNGQMEGPGESLAIGYLVAVLVIYLILDIVFWAQKRSLPWTPHWRKAVACGITWAVGAAFYLYMPLASMSNPPLNWGYPRTVGGFIHAFTRGQYEKIHPTAGSGPNIVEQTKSWVATYSKQVRFILFEGPKDEFSLGYLVFAFIPLLFFGRLQPRERAWLLGLLGFYLVLGPFLLELFNPQPDRQSISLNKPFFIASHLFIAMAIGYGISLTVATLSASYQKFRVFAIAGCTVLALFSLWLGVADAFDPSTPYWIPRFAAVWSCALAVLAAVVLAIWRQRAPVAALLGIALMMPVWTYASHWWDTEQRGHLYGFWFGHDMFTPPFRGKDGKLIYSRKEREELLKTPEGKARIYPEMAKDTILFGGTDPGRFCPTYMIFCESFIKPKDRRDPEFDRRDVYIITQNALADGTYLQYIRAHYNRSAEKDIPFFGELFRSPKERELNFKTNLFARMVAVPLDNAALGNGARIEKERRAGSSFFKPEHFLQLTDFAKKLDQGADPVSQYLRDNLSPDTRKLLGSGSANLAGGLAKDLNRILDDEWKGNLELPNLRADLATFTAQLGGASLSSGERKDITKQKEEAEQKVAYYSKLVPLYAPDRFKGVPLSDHVQIFIKENPTNHSRIRLSRLLLEAAYPKEISVSLGGVYPDTEIHTPSNEESQRCFQEYMNDAQERMKRGALKPGEDVKIVDNRVQVSGQVAVMAINALLARVIFDANPNNEFYVEESFPLEWMYDYLTPFGIIMKINREKLPELSQEIVDRDHVFWSDYSERLIGNWITYDTPISNITQFAERVYVNKDYRNFKGDPAFARDEDGQKAFSKLRSSIAGVYAWRVTMQTANRAAQIEARQQAQPQIPLTPEERHALEVHQRMFREAEFAFKQAYAFCPYSPEALYRYVQLLAGARRFDDAVLLAKTSKKLDPANTGLDRLVDELQRMRASVGPAAAMANEDVVNRAEAALRLNPTDLNNATALVQMYASQGRTVDVIRVADTVLAVPNASAQMVSFAAQIYQQLPEYNRLERALERWVQVNPTAEAWLDYAAAQAVLNKRTQALASLQRALTLSAARLKDDPKAENLAVSVKQDGRFASLKGTPEFEQLVATNTGK